MKMGFNFVHIFGQKRRRGVALCSRKDFVQMLCSSWQKEVQITEACSGLLLCLIPNLLCVRDAFGM